MSITHTTLVDVYSSFSKSELDELLNPSSSDSESDLTQSANLPKINELENNSKDDEDTRFAKTTYQ
jgi:hypothetical protein